MPSKGSFCAKSDALLIDYVKTTLGSTLHEKQEVQNFRATRAIPGMTRTPALPPSKLLRMRNETTFSHFPHPRTGCRQLKLCTLAQFCTLDTYQKTKIPELLIWTRTSPSKLALFLAPLRHAHVGGRTLLKRSLAHTKNPFRCVVDAATAAGGGRR